MDRAIRSKMQQQQGFEKKGRKREGEERGGGGGEEMGKQGKFGLQGNYLKQSIISLTQNDVRPPIKALPPLPTLDRCFSPSSAKN